MAQIPNGDLTTAHHHLFWMDDDDVWTKDHLEEMEAEGFRVVAMAPAHSRDGDGGTTSSVAVAMVRP